MTVLQKLWGRHGDTGEDLKLSRQTCRRFEALLLVLQKIWGSLIAVLQTTEVPYDVSPITNSQDIIS